MKSYKLSGVYYTFHYVFYLLLEKTPEETEYIQEPVNIRKQNRLIKSIKRSRKYLFHLQISVVDSSFVSPANKSEKVVLYTLPSGKTLFYLIIIEKVNTNVF